MGGVHLLELVRCLIVTLVDYTTGVFNKILNLKYLLYFTTSGNTGHLILNVEIMLLYVLLLFLRYFLQTTSSEK
jgi:hypothetical protein